MINYSQRTPAVLEIAHQEILQHVPPPPWFQFPRKYYSRRQRRENLVFTQDFRKVGKANNPYILKIFQSQKVLIPGDNEVNCGLYGTFEDAIIRFIGELIGVRQKK